MPATTTGSPFSLAVPSVSTDLADLFGTYLKPNMATINTYAAHKGTAQTFSALQTFSAGITVSASGASITGNSTITGTLTGLTGLTVSSGGASITGNSSITGTLTGLTGLTVASGGAIITSGNVGIGTSSPAYKLDVAGDIRVSTGLYWTATDKKLYVPLDGCLEWFTHNSASDHSFAVSHQGAKKVVLNTNGDSYFIGGAVGIGTTTPGSFFDVNGNARAVIQAVTGLTGATTQIRYVGGVTGSVAPTSGTFALGDVVVGTGGVIFVCTTAGTPGTWATVGASTATVTYRQSFLLAGM